MSHALDVLDPPTGYPASLENWSNEKPALFGGNLHDLLAFVSALNP